MRKFLSKTQLALVAGLAGVLLFFAPSAQAAIIFTPGNIGQPNELAVTFNNGDTGATITGTTGAGNPNVLFSSLTSQTLTVQGQHIQNNAAGDLTNLNATVPGFQLADFIFGLQTLSGTATVAVTDNQGDILTLPLVGGPGNTFAMITTAAGESITNVAIVAPGGFDFLQQANISGPTAVPKETLKKAEKRAPRRSKPLIFRAPESATPNFSEFP
jgi:hypothetical protein